MLKYVRNLLNRFLFIYIRKMLLTEEQKKKIIDTLSTKKAVNACPRCGKTAFTLVDGIFNQTVQSNIKSISLGGISIPTVIVSCDNCGFLSQHSIGVLGLLDLFK